MPYNRFPIQSADKLQINVFESKKKSSTKEIRTAESRRRCWCGKGASRLLVVVRIFLRQRLLHVFLVWEKNICRDCKICVNAFFSYTHTAEVDALIVTWNQKSLVHTWEASHNDLGFFLLLSRSDEKKNKEK